MAFARAAGVISARRVMVHQASAASTYAITGVARAR
jgi:hypothetical protein